jgi:hypothetical protein
MKHRLEGTAGKKALADVPASLPLIAKMLPPVLMQIAYLHTVPEA